MAGVKEAPGTTGQGTESGKRLLWWAEHEHIRGLGGEVAAIEAEARATLLAELERWFMELDYRMVEWWAADGETYSLYQVVSRLAVKELIDKLAEAQP